MRKIITILGIIFLIFFSIVFYENYVDPKKPTERVYIDTCFVDSVKNDSL